jgi:hypothetical protein
MKALPASASDDELIRFIDQWASLLEREDYAGAYAHTEHDPARQWTPELMRHVIKDYGDRRPNQRVTVIGAPSDVRQRKEVSRSANDGDGYVGEIWYDLNIDGAVSDLTATFDLVAEAGKLNVRLHDIHVM